MERYIAEADVYKLVEPMGTARVHCSQIDALPRADVVPQSEAVKWYHEYHATKEELKQEKIYHNSTIKLADKYFAELQTAKSEVARELLEELESVLTECECIDRYFSAHLHVVIEEFREKYTEGKEG